MTDSPCWEAERRYGVWRRLAGWGARRRFAQLSGADLGRRRVGLGADPNGPGGATNGSAGTGMSPVVLTSVTTSAISLSSIPIMALCWGLKTRRLHAGRPFVLFPAQRAVNQHPGRVPGSSRRKRLERGGFAGLGPSVGAAAGASRGTVERDRHGSELFEATAAGCRRGRDARSWPALRQAPSQRRTTPLTTSHLRRNIGDRGLRRHDVLPCRHRKLNRQWAHLSTR